MKGPWLIASLAVLTVIALVGCDNNDEFDVQPQRSGIIGATVVVENGTTTTCPEQANNRGTYTCDRGQDANHTIVVTGGVVDADGDVNTTDDRIYHTVDGTQGGTPLVMTAPGDFNFASPLTTLIDQEGIAAVATALGVTQDQLRQNPLDPGSNLTNAVRAILIAANQQIAVQASAGNAQYSSITTLTLDTTAIDTEAANVETALDGGLTPKQVSANVEGANFTLVEIATPPVATGTGGAGS